VLTGQGITGATLTVGSHTYTMHQNGKFGSWSADSNGLVTINTSASADYSGSATNPQLVLSSCTSGGGIS